MVPMATESHSSATTTRNLTEHRVPRMSCLFRCKSWVMDRHSLQNSLSSRREPGCGGVGQLEYLVAFLQVATIQGFSSNEAACRCIFDSGATT